MKRILINSNMEYEDMVIAEERNVSWITKEIELIWIDFYICVQCICNCKNSLWKNSYWRKQWQQKQQQIIQQRGFETKE